jgi:hypothetical protein
MGRLRISTMASSIIGDNRFGEDGDRRDRSANPSRPSASYLARHLYSVCREIPNDRHNPATVTPSNGPVTAATNRRSSLSPSRP